jgi:hypothetical protein
MGAVVLPAADDLVSHTLLIGALSAGVAGLMFQVSCTNMSITTPHHAAEATGPGWAVSWRVGWRIG